MLRSDKIMNEQKIASLRELLENTMASYPLPNMPFLKKYLLIQQAVDEVVNGAIICHEKGIDTSVVHETDFDLSHHKSCLLAKNHRADAWLAQKHFGLDCAWEYGFSISPRMSKLLLEYGWMDVWRPMYTMLWKEVDRFLQSK